MNNVRIAVVLMIFCTVFTSVGQILWKMGTNNVNTALSSWLNWSLILGFIAYGVGALLMVIAFSKGEVSILYPLIASSYIWVSLLSVYLLGDNMNGLKLAGNIIIFISVGLLGWSGWQNKKSMVGEDI